MTSAAHVDRRQRAREAFDDRWSVTGGEVTLGNMTWAERLQRAREEAIETATRVRIDDDVLKAAQNDYIYRGDLQSAIKAAFEAAGFEVEK